MITDDGMKAFHLAVAFILAGEVLAQQPAMAVVEKKASVVAFYTPTASG